MCQCLPLLSLNNQSLLAQQHCSAIIVLVYKGSGTFLHAANHVTEEGSEKNEFKLVMLKFGTLMSALGCDIGPSILQPYAANPLFFSTRFCN
ncbi:hypothetical protein RIF29_00511 [Crotalaria pallida]|uniref:Uncharacterized protein n=1 Tax=Crotalaria pallida TaxID=3830 RepID=A0AAN9IWQ1_CROPI